MSTRAIEIKCKGAESAASDKLEVVANSNGKVLFSVHENDNSADVIVNKNDAVEIIKFLQSLLV